MCVCVYTKILCDYLEKQGVRLFLVFIHERLQIILKASPSSIPLSATQETRNEEQRTAPFPATARVMLPFSRIEDEDPCRSTTTTLPKLSQAARTVAGVGEGKEITDSYCLAGSGGQLFIKFLANPGRTKPIRDHHHEALVSHLKLKPCLNTFEAPVATPLKPLAARKMP